MPIYNWDGDRQFILDNLCSPASLKLCVKVIDDPLMIEGWIQHHARIVGYKNLIVADNGSADPFMFDIYRRYSNLITIFQFDGPHNQIHWHPRFTSFFDAIKATCRYFSFVDVDERLVRIEKESWIADPTILQNLEQADGIIPTTWLINTLGSFDTFSLLDSEYTPEFKNNLRWGKPILPAQLVGIQSGIHNLQFDRFEFSTKFGTHLFLLHLTQFPQMRIAANRHKLLSRGVIEKDTPIETIALMNFDNHPDKTLPRFVKEIRVMCDLLSAKQDSASISGLDRLRLREDGGITFSTHTGQLLFAEYLLNGPTLIRTLFGGSDLEEGKLNDAPSLLRFSLQMRARGDFTRAETLFRRGMALYPDFLDQYKGPAFRKELMRMFLARGEWLNAEQLAPAPGDVGGDSWHYILFARQYSLIGDEPRALEWWRLVLKNDPSNGEAKNKIETV